MLFLILCTDGPGRAAIRAGNYEEHRAYLRESPANIKLAGPQVSDDGTQRIGSVFVVDVPDRAAAEAFAAGDPFARAGLFDRVLITRFLDVTRGKPVFGPVKE
jgi:uncharacterized protein YciI